MSFTLTMWDVKYQGRSNKYSKNQSFTLTMWDVKKISEISKLERTLVLP